MPVKWLRYPYMLLTEGRSKPRRPFVGVTVAYLKRRSPNHDVGKEFLEHYVLRRGEQFFRNFTFFEGLERVR